jgi:hypothetical protein
VSFGTVKKMFTKPQPAGMVMAQESVLLKISTLDYRFCHE